MRVPAECCAQQDVHGTRLDIGRVELLGLLGAFKRLLLQRGQTSAADALLIARTLQLFAVGLLFFSLFQLLSRAFYSMQDTRTPALVNIGAAAVNMAQELGLILRFVQDSVAFCPPLIITADEIHEMFDIAEKALDQAEAFVRKEGLRNT